MDSEQWRSLQLSDHHQHSANVPKLQLVDQQLPASGLALFAPDPNSNFNKTSAVNTSLSPFPDSVPTRFPMGTYGRMGYFSLAQWQELELQALIYKYMLAGAPVPMELILPIRKSLLSALPYCHHPQQHQHFQPATLRARYWGRCAMDLEPGRCRRTDGKKWRCSREVVPGQKYCERHVHRGRNRSRKHVEIPTPTAGSGLKTTFTCPLMNDKEAQFTLSGSSPTLDILPLDQRAPDAKPLNGSVQQSYTSKFALQGFPDDKSDGRVLRRFFDDWPRSKKETLAATNNNVNSATSTTNLSISIPGNSSSDFSLKLSTGNSDEKTGPGTDVDIGDEAVQQPSAAGWSGWGNHREASMGDPLAEALRSSTSTPSPRSILQKPNGSVSEASSISI